MCKVLPQGFYAGRTSQTTVGEEFEHDVGGTICTSRVIMGNLLAIITTYGSLSAAIAISSWQGQMYSKSFIYSYREEIVPLTLSGPLLASK